MEKVMKLESFQIKLLLKYMLLTTGDLVSC